MTIVWGRECGAGRSHTIRSCRDRDSGPHDSVHRFRRAAHSLKSSSANLGAMSLSAAAKRIELGARQESLERPAVAVAVGCVESLVARLRLRWVPMYLLLASARLSRAPRPAPRAPQEHSRR